MLVIARRKEEAVIMQLADGRRVEVKFLGFTMDGEVRLGISAERDIPVHRAELLKTK